LGRGITMRRALNRSPASPRPSPPCTPLRHMRIRSPPISRNKILQRPKQPPARKSQFLTMRQRNTSQLSIPARRKLHQHLPPVHPATRPPNQPALFKPVHQFHRAVMLNLQPFGKKANRGFLRCRDALNSQQRLILLRFQASSASIALAEIQIPANRVPKFRERLKIKSVSAGRGHIQTRLYRNPM
jgi:hypothetical protein